MELTDSDLGNSSSHFAGIRHAEWNGTSYFFSWEHPQTRNATATWFQARNVCRRHCMDSVSLGALNFP